MQVSVGLKGDYSARAVLCLARHCEQGRLTAREIASEMAIPRSTVATILSNLVRHGLLSAAAGPTGGYRLARGLASITLLEVVEAAEGPVRPDLCLLRGGACDRESVCALHEVWAAAGSAFTRELASTSFAELAAADG